VSAPPDRRRAVIIAGHTGDTATAHAGLDDADASVRAAAIGALARLGRLSDPVLAAALADPDPAVRRRAASEAALHPGVSLLGALEDPDPTVVEMAAFACGEREQAEPAVVSRLATLATRHADTLVREAAVAALGAIGDEAGLPAILAATGDKPPIRRRAVIALAPFEGPAVDDALRRALDDRDWQVRQAAEDLLAP
jgi:HEAT repeat protein